MQEKKLFIIDDHPLFREGLIRFIEGKEGLTVCGEAENADEALALISEKKPDLIATDLTLPGPSGIELIKQIKAADEKLKVLVISMHDELLYAERAIRAGASGYVMKEEATENVIAAIRKVLDGHIYLSEQMTEKTLQKQLSGSNASETPIDSLSDRELEVFELIGKGEQTAEIAKKLHLSIKTIETYRGNIKHKLALSNNTELIKHAVQWVQSKDLD